MAELIEINAGEIRINCNSSTSGKITLDNLGLTDNDLVLNGGFLRLVLDLEGVTDIDYFAVPTIEIAYKENTSETHWQCDFNGETILDKMDHHGHSTVILLNRKRLSELEHRHENKLIIHAEFPQAVHLIAADSYIHILK